jgi:hypothetical protein
VNELGPELNWQSRVAIPRRKNSAARAIPRLQHNYADTSVAERASGREPRRASTDDYYIR